jgi:ABC-type transport system involved in multi-copper enzyme maturation permease subunit
VSSALPFMALVKRELICSLRRPWSFVVLCLISAGVIALVLKTWPEGDMPLSNVGWKASSLLWVVFLLLKVACFVVIPGLAGASIVHEKETRSLEMLRITLIGPWAIVLGKLVNALGLAVALFVAVFPVLAAVMFLVGVDWVEFLFSFVSLVSLAALCAAVGLRCSATYRKTHVAVMAGYLWLIPAWIAGSLISWSIYIEGYVSSSPGMARTLLNAVPPAAWQALGESVVTMFCLFGAVRRLKDPAGDEQSEIPRPADEPLPQDEPKPPSSPSRFTALKRNTTIEDNRNPVYVMELGWGQTCSTDLTITKFCLFLMIFLLVDTAVLLLNFPKSDRHLYVGAILLVHILVVSLIGPATLAQSYSKEKEGETFDMIRMTLLSPREFVWGKLCAGLASMCPVVGASLMLSLPFAALMAPSRESLLLLIIGYVTIGVCVLASLGVGLLSSVVTRKVALSMVLSYVLAFLLFAGIVLTLAVLGQLGLISKLGEQGFIASPIVAFLAILGDFEKGSTLIPYWVGSVITFTVLGLMCIGLARSLFETRWMLDE